MSSLNCIHFNGMKKNRHIEKNGQVEQPSSDLTVTGATTELGTLGFVNIMQF
jgi:hypothetical protein